MSEKNKIFVGGLNLETTTEGLKDYFLTYGEVTDAIVMTHMVESSQGSQKKSRGFGFVTFAERDSLEKCLEDQHEIDGKTVECKIAQPKESGSARHNRPKVKKIFLGGISPETKDDDIKVVIQELVPNDLALDVKVMTEKGTEKPRGFAFVIVDPYSQKDNDYVYDVVDKLVAKNYIKILDRNVEVKHAQSQDEIKRSVRGRSSHPQYGGDDYREQGMYGGGGALAGFYPTAMRSAYGYGYGGMDYYRGREYPMTGYPPAAMGSYDRSRGGGYGATGYENPYNYMMGSYSQTSSGYGPTRGYGDTADRSRDAARSSYHPYTRTAYK